MPLTSGTRLGRRFLVARRQVAIETPTPLTVVINWPSLVTWPDKK